MSKNNVKNWYEQRWFYRIMEMVPGFLSWGMLLGPLALAFYYPDLVAIWVLVFDLYWLFKALEVGWRLILGYRKIRDDAKVNYFLKLKNLKESDISCPKKKWNDLWQVVLLPSFNEGIEIIRPSIESYLKSDYPKERIIIVMALEERAGQELNRQREVLKDYYKDKFADFLIYIHPDGIKGELKGKSANATWATKQFVKYLDEKKIDYSDVLLSNFDCDTRVHPQYFANLSYKYLIAKNRIQKTYQPIPMFNNNIWDIPLLTRTVAISASFWQIIESTRSYRMVNFSSQAMSLQALVDINFWDVTIVSEDSRQYYRAMFHYGGDHEVIPLYTPVYMDAVLSDNFWKTMRAQYFQMRRWAWGVEHFPFMVVEGLKDRRIHWYKKFVEAWRILDGHFSWATVSIFIMLSGWYPFLANADFVNSPMSYYLPFWASKIVGFAMVGLFISMLISFLMLPPKPPKYGKWSVAEMIFMWVLVIFNSSLFGSLPALDSQTRMIFGWRLGFWVTEKKVKK
jgi:hypothetical protein